MPNLKVVIIDDESSFLEIMSFWMKSKGYEVIALDDARNGIEAVRKNLGDIVFVDYKMPGANGVEVIKEIRRFNPTIPVVLITAHAYDAMKSQAKVFQELNIAGFFSKSDSFNDLEKTIQVVLNSVERSRKISEGE